MNQPDHIPGNGWIRDKRYVDETLADLKKSVTDLSAKIDGALLQLAERNGRDRAIIWIGAAIISLLAGTFGEWLSFILHLRPPGQ